MSHFFDVLDRTAATRAVNQPHQRNPQVIGHLFGEDHLVADGAIVGAPPHREVVPHHHGRLGVDACSAHDHIGGHHILELSILVVLTCASQHADLDEGVWVSQAIDPLAHRQFARIVLASHLVFPTHFQGQLLA